LTGRLQMMTPGPQNGFGVALFMTSRWDSFGFFDRVQKKLDTVFQSAQDLTMFKNNLATEKAENTRQLIFEKALELFRERGFDDATMQEIAARAGVAKGAAYYYFPGKEAIIQAYYESIQAE